MLTSELAVSGYPPEDLILKKSFLDKIVKEVKSFARETKDGGPAILLGAPWRKKGKIFNAALLLAGGKILGEALKCELPNYGVFDEKRIFSSASNSGRRIEYHQSSVLLIVRYPPNLLLAI